MSAGERDALEEELINLRKLLDFYIGFGRQIRSLNAREMEDHIDVILDRINQINTALDHEN